MQKFGEGSVTSTDGKDVVGDMSRFATEADLPVAGDGFTPEAAREVINEEPVTGESESV